MHSFWGTGGLWPLDWTASPFLIVVNQKGLSVLFLPKISAERVSALKYPFCLSAERLSFGRKALFWQKPALSAGSFYPLCVNNLLDILQKDPLLVETKVETASFGCFCRKNYVKIPVFLQKEENLLSVDH